VVFVPKYRKKSIFRQLRKPIGGVLRTLCEQEGVEMVEGHAMSDHVHWCLSIPPKYSLAHTVGFLKGMSAIRIHREFLGRERNFTGFHSWARGYCVSTIGLDEKMIREYIRNQEEEEKRAEPLPLGGLQPLRPARRGFSPFRHPRGPLWGPSSSHRLCRWQLTSFFPVNRPQCHDLALTKLSCIHGRSNAVRLGRPDASLRCGAKR
jgi:putative transposase